MAHAAVRDRQARRLDMAPAVGAVDLGQRRVVAEVARLLRRDHRGDAGHGARRRGIDGQQPGMRMRGAQEDRVQHARRRQVRGVAPATRQQPRILQPAEGLAQPGEGVEGHQREQAAPPSTQNFAQCGWFSATGRAASASVAPSSNCGS